MSIVEEDLKIRRLARAADDIKKRLDKSKDAYLNLCGDWLAAYKAWEDAVKAAGPEPWLAAYKAWEDAVKAAGPEPPDEIKARWTPDVLPMDADDREGVAG